MRITAPTGLQVLISISTTAGIAKVPTAWRGRHVRFAPVGANVSLLFGAPTAAGGVPTLTVTLAQGASIDGTTKVITPHAESGVRIADGQSLTLYIPEGEYAAYMGFDASGSGDLSCTLVDVP